MLNAAEQALVQISLNKLKERIANIETLMLNDQPVAVYVSAASQLLGSASVVAIQLTAEAVD